MNREQEFELRAESLGYSSLAELLDQTRKLTDPAFGKLLSVSTKEGRDAAAAARYPGPGALGGRPGPPSSAPASADTGGGTGGHPARCAAGPERHAAVPGVRQVLP
nr:hypothetical protein OG781_01845 [Streptomyces sp. NBC_00830]